MTESPTDPMIGRLIDGRYQVRSRIARGGMATVYLATDLRLERRVAIKIMHGHLADDNAFRSRFIQEARSAARLAHPNVVNVFDQGQDADIAYLVMEHLPGITLRDLLKDYGKLTPEQTMDILEAVLSGLAAAHKAGIVHRDVKPENVLLADDGRIKIGDFGLARAVNNNTATGQALLGTVAYLSPELVTRGIADARSDIYALGIMTYEMLTGEQPYVGEAPMQVAYQHANDTVPMPSLVAPGTPTELDELVLWATARDPEERPRDARVMLDQLLDVEKLVRPQGDTAMQATMVLPRGIAAASADAETQILGRSPLAVAPAAAVTPADDDEPDNTAQLAGSATKRRRRGYWLFALIVFLAALAGGVGWYFGAGPGSEVQVPSLVSVSPEEATATLEGLGLVAEQGTEYSTEIPAGLIVSTDPGDGARVAQGSTVTLNVSQGPAPITLPPLAGLSADAAASAIAEAKAVPGEVDEVFNGDVEEGLVLSASRESDGSDISAGGDYFEGLNVNFVVSLGPIPDVGGESLDDAVSILEDKGLVATAGEETYSDTIAEGDVISVAAAEEGPIRAGSTLILTVSRGPEPVEIPNVVGMAWSEGKQVLTDLGFKLNYNLAADAIAAIISIKSTDPAAGTLAAKGSSITLTPTNPFG
ncbi:MULTISPECIES: Stk1 family PASTA domain-containing Ser/Thr kinase [unclassified Cryobacterium]|uniref:Stk1 family PASTA domain-containing Ser/Thr kinase n=1 Tax=unclassified Cryobacterium TaxID=2649013 RepID=UPI00106B2EF5|nr:MULTISPECIES: Stk1 family PASTA domain-containing Ser/Thr kinase [unclassified Cryobacterium]TFC53445.1 Stk1 family PASTA domain-containing Ser/Thr kinase [Cryobacterium sp. TMB3-1-2]TFC69110.1 Stk1 family PASTA domain-containing Ser/Thr kinase [Cryobacterium sp. TMB3-15]TFC76090.1 Stk1 family PASTA domain-containing Ser/Thr kinase [Cryobacterium sp. TMB3-10]TFD43905.1 Stk1 family PASTA domain-containing Ser/Thr kinase [Cryobacterium sp. TMB3-12]